jgi:hypothetical protein
VSTTAGVHFLDGPGCNVYSINQPYGFISVTPRTSNVWAVLNTFAFPDQAATPSVVGIYAQFGNFSNIYGNTGTINNLTVNYSTFLNVSVVSSILSKSISTSTLAVSHTLSVVNLSTSSAFLSSVNINNSLSPSTLLDVNGSMRASTLFITKDAYINGSPVYNTSNIISTVRGLGTVTYISTQSLISSIAGLGSVSYISSSQIVSTIQGLGSSGYVSSSQILSTVQGLGSSRYVSSLDLVSTTQGLGSSAYISTGHITSTIEGLGSSGYVSSAQFASSIQGLGSSGYVSSTQVLSTVQGLGTSGYLSSMHLASTVQGLGTSGYLSSMHLASTVQGLGTSGYLSSMHLASTVEGLGSSGYLSSMHLASTVQGLGSSLYVSSLSLVSTAQGLGSSGYLSTPAILLSSISTYNFVAYGTSTFITSSNIYIGNNYSTNTIRFIGTSNDGFGDPINEYTTTVVAERIYDTNPAGPINKSELLLFKGSHSSENIFGPDRVRVLTSGSFQVDIASNNSFWAINGNPPSTTIQAFVINCNGRVGIGCNSPGYTLDVYGSINASSISVNGSSFMTISNVTSTVQGLGTSGYISSAQFASTVQGLGSSGYVSSIQLTSTVEGLGSSGYVSSIQLTSTVKGLGSSGYVSSIQLISTVEGLGSFGYLSSPYIYVSSISTKNLVVFGESTIISSCNIFIGNNPSTNMIRFIGTDRDSWNGNNLTNPYINTVIAERLYYDNGFLIGSSELLLFKGKDSVSNPGFGLDRVRVLSAGGFKVDIASNGGSWAIDGNPPSTVIEALTIVSTGLIGINCNSPLYTLDVNGSINASSNIYINGNVLISVEHIVSTVKGLGSASYVSSSSLASTIQGLGTAGYMSSPVLGLTSTVQGLGSSSYVSSSSLASTIQGLGTAGYMSSPVVGLTSTIQGLGSSSYVSSSSLASTVQGLGSSSYVSSSSLASTVQGLGSSSYVSSSSIASTVQGLGTSTYVSSLTLISTIQGLGTSGYISSLLVANIVNNSNLLFGNSFSTNMIRFYGTAYDSISPFEPPGQQPASNFYATTVIAERLYYTAQDQFGSSELLLFKGKNADQGNPPSSGPDRVRVLTAGGFKVDIATNGGVWLSNGNPPNTVVEALTINTNGYLGILCNAPSYTLDVSGSINASGSITIANNITATTGNITATLGNVQGVDVIATSDFRLKTNIITIDSPLEKISAMRGVYFNKITDSTIRKVGVIAQEIETVLPEVVYTDDSEEKLKAVSYGNITSILIEGIKAQQSSIQSLITTISSLQSQVEFLQRPPL